MVHLEGKGTKVFGDFPEITVRGDCEGRHNPAGCGNSGR